MILSPILPRDSDARILGACLPSQSPLIDRVDSERMPPAGQLRACLHDSRCLLGRDFTWILALAALGRSAASDREFLDPAGTDAMTDERVVLAWQHHCEGKHAEAERLCREILRDDPDDLGSWRLLGEICLFQGKHEDSVDAYRQARRRSRLAPEDLNNLGVALVAQGKPAEAEEAYREALVAQAPLLAVPVQPGRCPGQAREARGGGRVPSPRPGGQSRRVARLSWPGRRSSRRGRPTNCSISLREASCSNARPRRSPSRPGAGAGRTWRVGRGGAESLPGPGAPTRFRRSVLRPRQCAYRARSARRGGRQLPARPRVESGPGGVLEEPGQRTGSARETGGSA